ncbi:protein STRUBBELIG-RECEPTOR FAMILY 3-like [Silene latifolia]|uniref:protein STRUBBELIG-RECEPTOR FAMILY 3-like n=1 Tax=Silene latifolia TaxID=37657 RepID=UPI003D78050E
MESLNLKVHKKWTFWLMMVIIMSITMSYCSGETDPSDVSAINNLYAALGSPPLPGWVPLGGDPCTEGWQGVLCVNTNITGISLTTANLGGQLGTTLNSFTSIISIDLSGNHIGGTIPANLPPTMRSFFLSANQFTGSIPDLSALTQLTDLSLNKNNLTGQIPDSFQQVSGLINLDLSGNNLSGPLPPSMGNLSSLGTLLLQDNKLTGVLDVLQNLPLINLNVMNNQFSGPIPPKLLSLPDFRGSGNPFNTSVLPSPPSASPAGAPEASLPGDMPSKQPRNAPSASDISSPSKSSDKVKSKKTVIVAALAVFILLLAVLGLWFGIVRWCKRRKAVNNVTQGDVKNSYEETGRKPKHGDPLPQTQNQGIIASQETSTKTANISNAEQKRGTDVKQIAPVAVTKDTHSIDMTGINNSSVSIQPVPPPRHYSNENITLIPLAPTVPAMTQTSSFPSSVKSFTVASLQQYTNSFSQDNLIGDGTLGSVYRADLPDGKVVAVKKLNNAASRQQSEDDFAQMVSLISKIQHENIVKLIGYCSEYEQKLIVYAYCNNSTLYDALHLDDEIHKKLSWTARVRIALGAAKALEYLHETSQPAIVHKNFKSINILLDDKLKPLISDCGLAHLLDSLTIQSLGGYGAPELELGTYTLKSDVFSFGVVMLELLTGRKSYDSARPRGEQFLVRWAIPQLHDIDALSNMVDPSLNGSYPSKSLSRFADIISLCVQAEPEFRPPMSEIVQDLLNMIKRES